MKQRRNKQGLFPLRQTRQGWLGWKGQVGQVGQNIRLHVNAERVNRLGMQVKSGWSLCWEVEALTESENLSTYLEIRVYVSCLVLANQILNFALKPIYFCSHLQNYCRA